MRKSIGTVEMINLSMIECIRRNFWENSFIFFTDLQKEKNFTTGKIDEKHKTTENIENWFICGSIKSIRLKWTSSTFSIRVCCSFYVLLSHQLNNEIYFSLCCFSVSLCPIRLSSHFLVLRFSSSFISPIICQSSLHFNKRFMDQDCRWTQNTNRKKNIGRHEQNQQK